MTWKNLDDILLKNMEDEMPVLNYHHQDMTNVLKNHEFEVFAHGCNCFCNMGAGIARTVKQLFHEAYKLDKSTKRGDKSKLGTINYITIDDSTTVVNAYTQYEFGGQKINANYRAIASCFKLIDNYMLEHDFSHLVIPKIGAGLAGGNWKTIEQIIIENLSDNIITDVYYL